MGQGLVFALCLLGSSLLAGSDTGGLSFTAPPAQPRTFPETSPPTLTAMSAVRTNAMVADGVRLAAPAQAPAHALGLLDDKQKLGIGDRITFRVVEDEEPTKSLTITDSGDIDVPELGLVQAASKTCRQLALEIKAKLETTTYYRASVIIGIELLNKTLSGRKVYVVGEVRTTGPQEIPAGEAWTVSKALLRAGGFTDFADTKRVRLMRGNGTKDGKSATVIVNVADILEKGKTELDVPLEPEDMIYVPARAINFF